MRAQPQSRLETSMSERVKMIPAEHLESELERETILCENADAFRDSETLT